MRAKKTRISLPVSTREQQSEQRFQRGAAKLRLKLHSTGIEITRISRLPVARRLQALTLLRVRMCALDTQMAFLCIAADLQADKG